MKKAGIALLALLVVLGLVVAMRWDDVQRLSNVNRMFDEDRIVWNFSNMDELMLVRDMETGPLPYLPVDLAPLPETVTIAGLNTDLAAFLEETDTTSLLVMQDGVIRFEDYYLDTERDDQRISWSVAKSFLSALVGRAIASGEISGLDVPVVDYVPELTGTAYEGASLRNVLNMASGVKFNEDYFDPKSDINKMGRALALGGSLDTFAAGLSERAFEPGTRNQYVSIDTHVIGQVLRAATGKSIDQLFTEAFGGMGLGPVTYIVDGEGENFVLGGLLMQTRGYAVFGELFRRGGAWNGQQIVPADWVAESTVASAPPVVGGNGGRTYGYQWWSLPDQAEEGDYFANGIYGQTVYVNPALKTVIVKTSADHEFRDVQDDTGLSTQVETILAMRDIARHYSALGN